MGRDLYEKYEAARHIFDTANAVLEFDLKKICFEGPKEDLSRTDISQPAILTVSIAVLKILEESTNNSLQPVVAAGLSLGEYSALVSAGVLSFENAIKLVYRRGQLMHEESEKHKGTMASVIGMQREIIEKICKDTGVQVANVNSPGQIVISGLIDNINKAAELARAEGAGLVMILDVSGPFHSIYMQDAGSKLAKELENMLFQKPKFPIISNVTASHHSNTEDIKRNLVFQVSSSVLWEDSVRLMAKDGINTLLEIGPGSVLKGLARRIDNNIKVYSIGEVKEVEEFIGGYQHAA